MTCASGVCFRLLYHVQEKWSAVYNVRTILLSIQSLLGGARAREMAVGRRLFLHTLRQQCLLLTVKHHVCLLHCLIHPRPADPNLDSPLNGHAASIWHNVHEYKKALLKHKSAHTSERRAS